MPIFVSLVWSGTFTVRGQAGACYWTAGVGASVIVLDPKACSALSVGGSGTMQVSRGNIIINSICNPAIRVSGSARIKTETPVTYVGGVSGAEQITPPPIPGPPAPDPLAHLPVILSQAEWEAIEAGDFPEWDLGIQTFDAEWAARQPYDVLDATKLIPEEDIPVRIVGRLVLDRNPNNFFAETEQVAFLPSNVVPGIDFTEDPLLQGRLFSYLDTQKSRLGTTNFHQIPVNAPKCPMHNFQRDGMMQMAVPRAAAMMRSTSSGFMGVSMTASSWEGRRGRRWGRGAPGSAGSTRE